MEIYEPSEAPYAIAFYAVSGVCGPILGPVCCSPAVLVKMLIYVDTLDPWNLGSVSHAIFLRKEKNFTNTLHRQRWQEWSATLWLLSGVTAFTAVYVFFFLPETLSANILLRRAQRFREQTGNQSYQSETEMKTTKSNFFMDIARQTVDDFKLSCMDPVILFVNIDTMLIYGILYLWFEFFPFGMFLFMQYSSAGCLMVAAKFLERFITLLRYSRLVSLPPLPEYSILMLRFIVAFFGILVGAAISVIIYIAWLYFYYEPRTSKADAVVEPELRLVPGQIGAICIPICLFIFAWTSRARYVPMP